MSDSDELQFVEPITKTSLFKELLEQRRIDRLIFKKPSGRNLESAVFEVYQGIFSSDSINRINLDKLNSNWSRELYTRYANILINSKVYDPYHQTVHDWLLTVPGGSPSCHQQIYFLTEMMILQGKYYKPGIMWDFLTSQIPIEKTRDTVIWTISQECSAWIATALQHVLDGIRSENPIAAHFYRKMLKSTFCVASHLKILFFGAHQMLYPFLHELFLQKLAEESFKEFDLATLLQFYEHYSGTMGSKEKLIKDLINLNLQNGFNPSPAYALAVCDALYPVLSSQAQVIQDWDTITPSLINLFLYACCHNHPNAHHLSNHLKSILSASYSPVKRQSKHRSLNETVDASLKVLNQIMNEKINFQWIDTKLYDRQISSFLSKIVFELVVQFATSTRIQTTFNNEKGNKVTQNVWRSGYLQLLEKLTNDPAVREQALQVSTRDD